MCPDHAQVAFATKVLRKRALRIVCVLFVLCLLVAAAQSTFRLRRSGPILVYLDGVFGQVVFTDWSCMCVPAALATPFQPPFPRVHVPTPP